MFYKTPITIRKKEERVSAFLFTLIRIYVYILNFGDNKINKIKITSNVFISRIYFDIG